MYAEGRTKRHIASLLCVSPQYVGKILNEKQNISAALHDDEDENELSLNDEYIKSRTEYTKTQNIKLQRQLAIESGSLMRRDYYEEMLRRLLKYYNVHKEWLRKNRTADIETLDSFAAIMDMTVKECKRGGFSPGSDIDEIPTV